MNPVYILLISSQILHLRHKKDEPVQAWDVWEVLVCAVISWLRCMMVYFSVHCFFCVPCHGNAVYNREVSADISSSTSKWQTHDVEPYVVNERAIQTQPKLLVKAPIIIAYRHRSKSVSNGHVCSPPDLIHCNDATQWMNADWLKVSLSRQWLKTTNLITNRQKQ